MMRAIDSGMLQNVVGLVICVHSYDLLCDVALHRISVT